MIPIKYRLDAVTEDIYVKKVISCIENPKNVSDELGKLLKDIEMKRPGIGRIILDDASRFTKEYPDFPVLCAWLVMSYQNLENIKGYFEQMIWEDLVIKNVGARLKNPNFIELKSYHGLRERRVRYKSSKMIQVRSYLRIPIAYDKIYYQYEDFLDFYKNFSKKEINNWIVEKTDMKVCPYCNISYTYNRGRSVTAQLDHFFPKSEYPMFALCFYNLVPSCSACNKIKHDEVEELASPYKENVFQQLRITWEYEGETDDTKYEEKDCLEELEKHISVKLVTPIQAENENLSTMKISEAYQKHKDYAGEVIKKVKTYANPDAQKLICDICDSAGVTPEEVMRFYFGNYLKKSELKNRPLSKMTRDFYEEYKKFIRK